MANKKSKPKTINGTVYDSALHDKARKMIAEGKTQQQVAGALRVSVTSVRNWLGLTKRPGTRGRGISRTPLVSRRGMGDAQGHFVTGDPALLALRNELRRCEARATLLRRVIEELQSLPDIVNEPAAPAPNGQDVQTAAPAS